MIAFFRTLPSARVLRPALFLTTALVAAGLIMGPAKASSPKQQPAPAPAPAQSELHSFAGSYLAGQFAGATGDVAHASEYIDIALQRDPTNATLLAQAFKFELTSGHIDKAAAIASKLQGKLESPLPAIVLTASQVRAGKLEQAAKTLTTTPADGMSEVLLPLMSLWVDYGRGTLPKRANIDQMAGNAQLLTPFVNYQLALLYDVAGPREKAALYYNKLAAKPADLPYRVLQALTNYYTRKGDIAQGRRLYSAYLAAHPENLMIDAAFGGEMADLAPDAKAPNGRLVNNASEGIAEIFFNIAGMMLYEEELAPDAIAYLQLALYLRPNFPAAEFSLASVEERTGNLEQAQLAYRSIPRSSPYYRRAQLRAAVCEANLGRTDKALAEIDKLSHEQPNRYDALVTKGDILRGKSRFPEATVAYSEALARIPKLEAYHWPILFSRAISYERTGHWDKTEQDLLKALALAPDQPDMLNYLGYSWLVSGKNVAQAREMIEKALAARPGDAQITDSMGWALYTIGQFDEAVSYLEQAVELEPGESVINDHLGDAYWRAGRKTEARFQWNKALSYASDTKETMLIRHKLERGLDPFVPMATLEPAKAKISTVR